MSHCGQRQATGTAIRTAQKNNPRRRGDSDNFTTAFTCLRCGACCIRPGDVRLLPGETERIASFLKIETYAFTREKTKLAEDRRALVLNENPDGSCIFYNDSPPRCMIQAAKPRQCLDFPLGWTFENWREVCLGAVAMSR